MNLREALLRGIYAYGFEKPSLIQQRAIVPCIKGWCLYFVSSMLIAYWKIIILSTFLPSNVNHLFLIVGLDVIAQAQSGTGKTATFSIAILQKLDVALKECQALVLAPTRELAQQVI